MDVCFLLYVYVSVAFAKDGEQFMELWEGLGYAGLVVDRDRAVCAEGCDLEGHDHAVVVVGCVDSALKEARRIWAAAMTCR